MYTFVSNAGNGRRARREQGTVVRLSKPHMFFVSYMCFLSPITLKPPSHTEKRKKKNLLLIKDGEQGGVCGGRGGIFFFFLPPIQNKASCSLCLALFVCISSYSSGRPCMEGRKKDSSLTAFDVHVLWSHVSALSVKSFCCPSA